MDTKETVDKETVDKETVDKETVDKETVDKETVDKFQFTIIKIKYNKLMTSEDFFSTLPFSN
jgi:hypothetical protein